MKLLRDLVNWKKISEENKNDYDFSNQLGIAVGYVLTSYPHEIVFATGKKARNGSVSLKELALSLIDAREGREPANVGNLFRFGASVIYALELSKQEDLPFFIPLEDSLNEALTNLRIDEVSKEAIVRAVKSFTIGIIEGYNKGRELLPEINIEDQIPEIRELFTKINLEDLAKGLDVEDLKVLDRFFFKDFMTQEEKETFVKTLLRVGEPHTLDLYTRIKAQEIQETNSKRFTFGYDDPFTANPNFFRGIL